MSRDGTACADAALHPREGGLAEVPMASPNVHPEFGYFCVSPRLRRDLRVAAYSILLGAVVGAGGIIALGAGSNRGANGLTNTPATNSNGQSRAFRKGEGAPAPK